MARQERNVKIRRHPALLVVLVGVCGVTGCHGAAHKATGKGTTKKAAQCRLQVSGRRGARAVVTYDDATGNAKMAAAISTEVAAWNASTAPVLLTPSRSNPAITFRSVPGEPTVEKCGGTAPRVVTIELSTPKWDAAAGSKTGVKDPAGAIAHDIGRALGLATGGSCPSLMSANSCPHRAQTPGRTQLQTLQQLYGSATPSASP